MIQPIIHRFDEVDSTNNVALEMAKSGAPEGTVVVARSQTKGRGRRGRSWFADAGQNIILSAIVRPSMPIARYSELAFVAAVAAAELIEGCGLQPSVKWPNDVLIDDKKLVGILVEAANGAAVIGIGVNVLQSEFSSLGQSAPLGLSSLRNEGVSKGGRPSTVLRYEPPASALLSTSGSSPAEPSLFALQTDLPPEISHTATSLAIEGGSVTDVDDLTNRLIRTLFAIYPLPFEEILARWRKYMWGLGRSVEIETEGGVVSGKIAGVDTDGALLVSTTNGSRRIVAADAIHIVR